MKKISLYKAIALLFYLLLLGCQGKYAGDFSGTVVDVETGKPIEGAIVVVEWPETKGMPGMSYHESYKMIEVKTDKDGRFLVSGVDKVNIDDPVIVVYKEGYIAWRNDFIFPGWKKRQDFKYGRGISVKLHVYDEKLDRLDHSSFMDYAIISSPLKLLEAKGHERGKGKKEQQRNKKNYESK